MTQLPIAEWQTSLAGMESALSATLAALNRYEEGWGRLLAEPEAPPEEAEEPPAPLEARLREWDDRLTAAAELAASVERQLAEREAAVGTWQAAFTRYRDLLEQGQGEDRTNHRGTETQRKQEE